MKKQTKNRLWLWMGGFLCLVVLVGATVMLMQQNHVGAPPDVDTLLSIDDETCLKTLEDCGLNVPTALQEDRAETGRIVKQCLTALRDGSTPYSSQSKVSDIIDLDHDVYRTMGLDFPPATSA